MAFDGFVKTRTKVPPKRPIGGGRRTRLGGYTPTQSEIRRIRERRSNVPNGPRGTPNFEIPDAPSPSPYGEAGSGDGVRGLGRGAAYARFARRGLGGHPVVRGAGAAWDLYQFYGANGSGFGGAPGGSGGYGPPSLEFPQHQDHGFCGSPGDKKANQNQTQGGALCNNLPLFGQARPTNFGTFGAIHYREYNPPRQTVIVTGKQWRIRGTSPSPDPIPQQVVQAPGQAFGGPTASNPRPPRPRGGGTVTLPSPTGHPVPGTGEGSTGGTRPDLPDIPDVRPIGRGQGRRPNPHRPPPEKTKETKAVTPKWYMKLVDAAWEVTEYCDAAEAMFDCLPDSIKKTVKKTGRTLPSAVVGPGKHYLSCQDKAEAVYKHRELITPDCATKKLVCNHLMDEVVGRFLGTADTAAQRGKVSGFGQSQRYSAGYYLSDAEKIRIKTWIKEQPGLEKMIESVGCEKIVGLLQ